MLGEDDDSDDRAGCFGSERNGGLNGRARGAGFGAAPLEAGGFAGVGVRGWRLLKPCP